MAEVVPSVLLVYLFSTSCLIRPCVVLSDCHSNASPFLVSSSITPSTGPPRSIFSSSLLLLFQKTVVSIFGDVLLTCMMLSSDLTQLVLVPSLGFSQCHSRKRGGMVIVSIYLYGSGP